MFHNQLSKIYKFSVRVRYAPSPTGPMHLGAVRTALFNYLFAKRHNGKFIVRIQDTDTARNVEGSEKDILDTLDWLGITPDQSPRVGGPYGPYIQSQRLNLYKQIQNKLLRSNLAYPCFCQNTPKQKKQNKAKDQPQQQFQAGYNGKCRKLTLQQVKSKITNGQKYAIRIKSDLNQLKTSTFQDQIFGNVTANPFDDFVLVKKNGFPTYHFANVIDDWKMEITHVIRGVEWLTNTSKHVYLYKIFGVQPPKFVHLPLIFTADGKKLSKRDPTAPIINLRKNGYLPQSIINYTGSMSYNTNQPESQQPSQAKAHQQKQKPKQKQKQKQKQPPKLQFQTLSTLIEQFDLANVKNSPFRSDIKKLNYFNRHYMRNKLKNNDSQFVQDIISKMREIYKLKPETREYSQEYLRDVVSTVIQRVSNYQDLKQFEHFFNKPNYQSQHFQKDLKKLFGPETTLSPSPSSPSAWSLQCPNQQLAQKHKKILHNLLLIFTHIILPSQYSEQKIAQSISQFLYDNKNEIDNQDVYHLLRLAVTGRKSGINIVRTCYVVGRDRVIADIGALYDAMRGSEGE